MVLKDDEFNNCVIQMQEGAPRLINQMILSGDKYQRNLKPKISELCC